MTARLAALSFGAHAPAQLAHFWAGVLRREVIDDPRDGVAVAPADESEFALRFRRIRQPKLGPNQLHFDLTSSSLDDQREIVDRAIALGARHLDIGQSPDEEHVVLADPEGNEFCVIEPGNNFLADTGRIGALSCDGTQSVGYFWSAALDWPLIWDQDEETAIQSPHGGSKISWGGPPLRPKSGENRLHLILAPPVHGDRQAEIDRLVELGATLVHADASTAENVVMADPDGNVFWLSDPDGSLEL